MEHLMVRVQKEGFERNAATTLKIIEQTVRAKMIGINIGGLMEMDRVMGRSRPYYDAYGKVKTYVDKMVVPFPEIKDTPHDQDTITLVFPIEITISPLPRYVFKEELK